MLRVPDLDSAVASYRRLGFQLSHGTAERPVPGRAFAVFGDFYLELRKQTGPDELALRSDDLDSDVTRVRSAGFSVSRTIDDWVDGDGGSLPRRSAVVDLFVPVRIVQHHHDPEARRVFLGSRAPHPNTATCLERVYVAVESIEDALPLLEGVLGIPAPEPEMGTVIMSLMSVFYLGDIGLAIAEPRGPGPTADVVEANGPGLFQVLFRAEHLDEAAGVIIDNGAPKPQRGTRLRGESALLNLPDDSRNLYVALAGSD